MNKSEIINNLNIAHLAFWNTAIDLPDGNISINDKWSVAQNVEHINLALLRVNNYLSLTKSNIEANFGLSNRTSINNEDFIKIYQKTIANGIKATDPYIPESNLKTDCKELIDQGKILLKSIISNLENWSEEELEKYNCPHPALGKITAREVLFFTIYHAQHHEQMIKRNSIQKI